MSVSNSTYRTDAEVVWCPGCGDFGILRAMQKAFAELQIPNEDLVLISGIGCSSRVPGYIDAFGFNAAHGRALPIAQGVKIARPELTVVAASGDGDCLAIGAGHFVHAGRRNADLTLILFDNQVYGLTKGQASPTSPAGDKMKLAAYGVPEQPMMPITLAVVLGATFAARGFSGDPKHLQQLLVQAIRHRGFSVVQVLTPCVTFRAKWDPYQTIKKKKSFVPDSHDVRDRFAAMALSDRQDDIYLGVFYELDDVPTYGELMDRIEGTAKAGDPIPPVEDVLRDFIH